MEVAEYLQGRDEVEQVFYAGLPSNPTHERAKRLTGGRGFGAIPSFVVSGGREAGQRFVEALQLHSHVANIGDVRSLVIHPASTTHSQLTPRGAGRCRRAARSGAPRRRPRGRGRHHRRPRNRLQSPVTGTAAGRPQRRSGSSFRQRPDITGLHRRAGRTTQPTQRVTCGAPLRVRVAGHRRAVRSPVRFVIPAKCRNPGLASAWPGAQRNATQQSQSALLLLSGCTDYTLSYHVLAVLAEDWIRCIRRG